MTKYTIIGMRRQSVDPLFLCYIVVESVQEAISFMKHEYPSVEIRYVLEGEVNEVEGWKD